jgi:hypothetical protein
MLPLRVICLLALLYGSPALVPTTAYRLGTITRAEAQESARVWVNTSSGVYHCPGSRYYGNTKAGAMRTNSSALPANRAAPLGTSGIWQ